jgi:hypothetical protein
MAQI